MYNPTLHVLAFNERIRAMNQMRSNELKLTAVEANNLHSDITTLLAEVARLAALIETETAEIVQVAVDGGDFK